MEENLSKQPFSPCGKEGECKIMDGYGDKICILQAHIIKEYENISTNIDFCDNKSYYHLLSGKGQFVIDFIDLTNRLEKLIKDLSVVEVLITKYSVVKVLKFNEIDYINFQLEVFYHKIHTILEVLKLLVNHVYDIGLSEEKCDWSEIKKSKNRINPNAFEIIEKYYKSFSSIINVRHLNTHRDCNVSPSSRMFSALFFLKDRKDEQYNKRNKLFDEGVESYKNEKVDFVHQSIDVAKFYVNIMNSILIDDVLKFMVNK